MAGQSGIVPVRYPAADLEIIEAAMAITRSATISAFTREASVKLARALIEASVASGLRPGELDWDASWIEGQIERREP
jgi:hypothetical protein